MFLAQQNERIDNRILNTLRIEDRLSRVALAKKTGLDLEDVKISIQRLKKQGYVETYYGRRLWVPEINSPNGMRRAGAERAAINAPMQGTAADLIKLAMIAVQNWLVSEHLQSK